MQSYHHRQQGVARFALQEDGDGIQPSLARLLLGVGAPGPPVLVLHAGVARVHLNREEKKGKEGATGQKK